MSNRGKKFGQRGSKKKGSTKLTGRNTIAFFKVYRDLLGQRKEANKFSIKNDSKLFKIDNQLLEMDQTLVSAISKSLSKNSAVSNVLLKKSAGKRKTYVKQKHNEMTLIEAIHSCMPANKRMKMKGILTALKKKGGYDTNSDYLYTMVNNKLHQDDEIAKKKSHPELRRGIFVYKYKSQSQLSKKGKKSGPSKVAVA